MNPDVQRLIDALFYLGQQPTREEVQKACELIYRLGKNDGAIEVADKMLVGIDCREWSGNDAS